MKEIGTMVRVFLTFTLTLLAVWAGGTLANVLFQAGENIDKVFMIFGLGVATFIQAAIWQDKRDWRHFGISLSFALTCCTSLLLSALLWGMYGLGTIQFADSAFLTLGAIILVCGGLLVMTWNSYFEDVLDLPRYHFLHTPPQPLTTRCSAIGTVVISTAVGLFGVPLGIILMLG